MKPSQRLLILARVTHYQHAGRLYAYTPYAREIEMWADLFSEVTIAGTCRNEPPPGDCCAFTRSNISICPMAEAGGDTWWAKLKQLFVLPRIIGQVLKAMARADAIHARCPCDLGLLGLVFGPVFSRYLIAKYATQWLPFPGEPWSWRLQRKLLKSWWWRGPVTVYGDWPGQPAKVTSFFTSVLTEDQLDRARRTAQRSRTTRRLEILFVGRLSRAKNVDVLLKAIAQARAPDCQLTASIIGEGPKRASLEKLARFLGLEPHVRFTGGLAFDAVLDYYERADVLVLASDIEGWPKAVAEGMAFGLVCIGSERGLMPQMLAEGRGLLVTPRDVDALAKALRQVAADPAAASRMAGQAAAWGQRFSLENLRESLRQLMERHWNLELSVRTGSPAPLPADFADTPTISRQVPLPR